MDTKIYLSQLAKTLAQKKHLSQKEAEAFLKEFFDAVIRNVTSDKSVKIKGMGVFKLVEVLDRESVDVSTGERIVIPGHTKLTFIPEAALKDIVNKPFADFQTVVINEGTNLEDMEKIPMPTAQNLVCPEPVEESESQSVEVPEEELQPVAPETAPEEEPEQTAPAGQTPEPGQTPSATVEIRAMTTAEKWALTLGVILLCAVSYIMGFYHVFDSLSISLQKKEMAETITVSEEIPEKKPAAKVLVPVQEEVPAETPAAKGDTVPPVPETKQEKAAESHPSPKAAPRSTLDAGKEYRITGLRGTYIMKSGDYLNLIAKREYGSRDFARYIITYNKLANPDNVPIGKEIKLPELEEVK